jgi:hypothetical protein
MKYTWDIINREGLSFLHYLIAIQICLLQPYTEKTES